jgi:hypothetical protein
MITSRETQTTKLAHLFVLTQDRIAARAESRDQE